MSSSRTNRGLFLALACVLALSLATPARATDVPMYGKIMLIKDTKLFKIVVKPDPMTEALYPLPGTTPTGLTSDLTVFIYNALGGALTDSLTAGTWSALGTGPSGYKYSNTDAPTGGAVKKIILKPNVIKVLAKDDGTLQPGPISGDVGVNLIIGADNYCASSDGGTQVKNDPTLWKFKDNPTPGTCPTPPPLCCNGDSFLSITSFAAAGDCGDIIDTFGMTVANVACSALYLGGGGNSVPLPITIPDMAQSIAAISSCTGQTATLGSTTSTQTGSTRRCTSTGCFFGPPVAIPNSGSTHTSVCVVNMLAAAASGIADCSTGAVSLSVPLGAVAYLTGDSATDSGGTIPGIQPCPLCSGSACIGGPNNGMTCTPGSSVLGPGYPTSQDCPPDPLYEVGTVPLTLTPTTASVTWTGTVPTNDTGSTASTLIRVFSGYCMNANTGEFKNPAQHCWENGMAVGPACSGAFETCEQRTNGAFGPNGGSNRTIRAIGNGMSIMGGSAAGVLVSLFSIPPIFDTTVDGAANLPGPAAATIPANLDLCASANPCP